MFLRRGFFLSRNKSIKNATYYSMTLSQYQRLSALWSDQNDEVTQVALIICDLYNYSHEELDNIGPKKFLKYSKKVERSFTRIGKKPWYSMLKLERDAKKITLGQFIEVQHFLKMGEIDSMHLVGASIWKDKRDHGLKSELLRNKKVEHVLEDITSFLLSFAELLVSYKGLFETDELQEENEDAKLEKPHPFIEQYGWIFSAKKVAEHEGITLEKAFELPIIQALNDLSYLKSEQSYQRKINE